MLEHRIGTPKSPGFFLAAALPVCPEINLHQSSKRFWFLIIALSFFFAPADPNICYSHLEPASEISDFHLFP